MILVTNSMELEAEGTETEMEVGGSRRLLHDDGARGK